MPEFQPAASDVDVCATESVFVHVTVVPALTVTASGMKADVPNAAAPTGIETEEAEPPLDDGVVGDGVGVGDAGVDEE